MPLDLYELMGDKRHTGEQRDYWFAGINAIVAINEDPEHQDRIKVIVPDVDEDEIHDRWITPYIRFVGPKGYGDSHRPGVGTEVIVFGRQNEKYNLFYVGRYNEDYLVPEKLRDPDVRGFYHDKDYKALTDRDFEIYAKRDLEIHADRDVELKAVRHLKLSGATVEIRSEGKVEIFAPGGLWVNGEMVVVP
jgi:hypothetical protein